MHTETNAYMHTNMAILLKCWWIHRLVESKCGEAKIEVAPSQLANLIDHLYILLSFCVLQFCATLGTTSCCSFDKIDELGPLCEFATKLCKGCFPVT